MRIRINFSKYEPMRFTGHLDLHRTWERTLRRAGLPLAYSHGYNPRPRINLASALPLGFTSQGEVVDVWLEEQMQVTAIDKKLKNSVPPGLFISKIEEVDLSAPSLQSQLMSTEYTITFLDDIPDLDDRLNKILTAVSLPRERRRKAYDLRPLIEEMQSIPNDEDHHSRLLVQLAAREGATGRPEEVILALGGSPESGQIHRTRLIFK